MTVLKSSLAVLVGPKTEFQLVCWSLIRTASLTAESVEDSETVAKCASSSLSKVTRRTTKFVESKNKLAKTDWSVRFRHAVWRRLLSYRPGRNLGQQALVGQIP